MAKPHYVPGYEVSDVVPQSHYYEEIWPHLKLLDKIGFRGDRYFVFYSKNQNGQALYEETEKRLSAEATYKRLTKLTYQKQFFTEVEQLLSNVQVLLDRINNTNLDLLTVQAVGNLLLEAYELEALVFAYFIACQPFRTVLFEDEVRRELKKRVAASRVEFYLTQLAVSEKPTKMSQEEADWVHLQITHYNELARIEKPINGRDISDELRRSLDKHYADYKILTLGDGSWTYDHDYYIKRLNQVELKPLNTLRKIQQKLKRNPAKVLKERKELIEELYLPDSSVKIIELLAELGHYRFLLRTDGFMPLIFNCISLREHLSQHKGLSNPRLVSYLTPPELKRFVAGEMVYTEEDGKKRTQPDEEWLYYIDNGRAHLLLGADAGKKFRKLVPPIDTSGVTEVHGSSAMRGMVQGKVCLYHWGDDLDEKMKSMEQNKILVAGHTRPAMMPLLRKAIGIVTDEGGVTSHAAIVSRELGLPSVINTHNATKVFREGDLVELDADHGVVRKIK